MYSKSQIIAVIISLTLLILPASLEAGQVNANLTYQPPEVNQVNNFHYFSVPNALISGNPGSPALPSDGVWMLLPLGEYAVSAELKGQVWRTISGRYNPAPISEPKRLSDRTPATMTQPDPDIYTGTQVYPAQPVMHLTTHLKRGFALATCEVFPVRWNPADGSLEYLAEAELVIETAPREREMTGFNRFFRGDRKTIEFVTGKVRNPNLLGMYPQRDDGDVPEAILIVTVDELRIAAEAHADWWKTRGRMTYIIEVEDILEEEDGEDEQECIRYAIMSAYDDWDIGYVLLMGDTEQVPHRGLYGTVGETVDNDIPADFYYSALDGNWNSNNNNRWGEANDQIDLTAEVAVGRIPGAFNREIQRHTNKVVLYSDEPVVDDILKALMVGENLGWDIMGGAYMDEIYAGSNRYNHVTAGFPERFSRRNLYDVENGWEWSGSQDFAPLVSSGHHMIHHLGHAITNRVFKLHVNAVTNNIITNNGQQHGFNIAYSQGCYSGAFDNRNTNPNQYFDYDCVAEKHVSGIDNGLVAFLCNSRYGWGNYQTTNGTSQHFEREFVDAIFDEDITIIGETNQDSKEDLAAWASNNAGMRWIFYEMNLFGDPAMDIWTDEPEEFDPEYTGVIFLGDQEFTLDVEGVEGAIVCLSRGAEIIAAGLTDDNGHIELEFDEPLNEPGEVDLTITAHNYLPFREEIIPVPSEGGFPWVVELIVDDPDGNGNSLVDAGETVFINPYIRNIGQDALQGLNLTLQTDDQNVIVRNETTAYPLIDAEGEEFAEESLELEILPQCRDLHEILVILTIQDENGGEWIQEKVLIVHAPIISGQVLYVLDDEGNNNGVLDPGEEAYLLLYIENTGTGDAEDITAIIVSDNPVVDLDNEEIRLASLPSGESEYFDPLFSVRISDDCPNPYHAVFYIRMSGAMGFYRTWLKELSIGGQFFTFERNEDEWEHYNVGRDNGDEWHLSNQTNNTPNGSHCLKVGPRSNDDDYAEALDCAIEIPEFTVTGPMQLSFWHKIDAECHNEEEDIAFDGGFVELWISGEPWELLEPETGYPYVIREGQTPNPIDEMPCYSGERDWEQAVFDLSDYEDEDVTIRFHFGSDGSVERSGWWIDDIQLNSLVEQDAPWDLEGEIRGPGAFLSWTTPNMQRDDGDGSNELIGYRIYRGMDILDTLIRDNQYFDNLVGIPRGRIYYMISAIYTDDVECGPSNEIELFWPASVNEDINALPTEWALTGIYPNPFNSLTRISYSVPHQGQIRMAVYDLSGRIVAELANGSQQPGSYQAVFNADGMPSGVYLIQLQTPVGAKVSRMVLIR
ncbi:MAG: C25 family cysteine peptidase [Candidatus Hatepunaea meridiana]|nr:C25 family cysteine peptidase [Candidatus Hatepunaea meridiana]